LKADLRSDSSCVNSSRFGIKWKTFGILAGFILIVLFVIWFFQVNMLDYFYLTTKFSELEESIGRIEEKVEGDENELKNTVFSCAVENYSSICVMKIEDGVARMVVEADGPITSVTRIMSDKDMVRLWRLAYENGGTYISTISAGEIYESKKAEIFENSEEDPVENAYRKSRRGTVSAVYSKLITRESGEYLIIETSDLTPVRATVKTLQRQFWWIGLILLILALGLAALLSRVITKPIIKLNEAAKQLAGGNYNGDFRAKGYREIDELSKTLIHAADELSKTDRLQKELISNVSHDLRTPLTMIKGYGEVMKDIPGENTPENIQVIIDETSRLTELVNDMLDISKIRAGTRDPKMEVFCITDTVRATLSRYEKLTERDGYTIDLLTDGDAYVFADRSMILQVIYNLVNNAVNYTGDDKRVTVRQECENEKVRISISDTGDGIAPEEIPLIWDRYYKVDKVHRRGAVGTGLGLSIVKGVLELHGARYGVNSRQGKGSVFWFELELCERDTATSEMRKDNND